MTKRHLLMSCASLATAVVGVGLLHAQAQPALIESQKLVMENPFVRVIEIQLAAGHAEPKHTHGRGLTVALTPFDNETRTEGGQWVKSHTSFGEVKWGEPVTHEARNTGTTAQHVIRIELK